MQDSELELCGKLLVTLHLSVDERRSLPGGRARLSVLVEAARRRLAQSSWLPEKPRPDVPYDGVIIELRDGDYWVHERHEIAMLQFSRWKTKRMETLAEAVRIYASTYGDGEIDGVPIDFGA